MAHKVSIVIATYNAAKTLDRCLSSISQQTFQDKELIVIDGGSTDGTVRLLEDSLESISYLHSGPDKGIYDAWNHALNHAQGEYVCFLGADDRYADPNAIRFMAEAIGNGSPDIVSGKGVLIDHEGRPIGEIGREWDYQALRRRIRICHPGTWFRRDLFDKYGVFDLRYKIVADYEWLLRLPESTTTIFVNRTILNVGHDGVSRSQVWRRLRERREAHMRCPRIGPLCAYAYWIDKLWRWPIARLLGLQF